VKEQQKHIDLKLENIPKVLQYIDFLSNIEEDDYIRYDEEHEFEYTPQFYGFIQALFDAGLVENYEKLVGHISMGSDNEHERCELFSKWMKTMNQTISRPCEMRETDIHFVRRAFLTIIRMEKIFPGSWGIDVETGTWLRLLQRVKTLYEAGELGSAHIR